MNPVREEGPALRTANPADRVALRGVRLVARLAGMSQKTTVEQTFVNLERRAIEAVYTFPLPESAAVCGFEVTTGDRVLTGTVEEAGQAIEQYEQAVGAGDGAFLLEQDRPDVFSVRVGNLKPGQAATIRLTYVCPLERVDKSVRVAFPTTVAPRYVTATATDPIDAMIDGDALNPPHVLHVPYGLTMDVRIDLGRRLRGVHSPSHPVRIETPHEAGDDATRVTLAGGVTEMNRDVVLLIDLQKEHEPSVQVARGPGGEGDGHYLAVTFVPEFDEAELVEPEPVETVFVLDCSGSMQGESIRQATAALELCLRSLSTGDTFNICRFGSTFELMASEPLHYSEETLRKALAYVRRNADLGGTELYAALHAVLTPSPRVGRTRQVIVLTDGQVSNEPAILELARQMRPRNRIFSFGIGAAASASLVKGLARASGGASEFITGGERIDEKVLRTFGRMTSPMVKDVSIDWDGCDVQTLAETPPVFDGDVLTVFGRAPGRLPKKVTLTCNTPTGPAQWAVAVPPPLNDGGVIATMWARRTIQSLEEVNGLQKSRHTRREKAAKSREEETVIRLSKQFNLLSSLTTFVALEHRSEAERNNGRPALRRVPVALAKGWGGVDVAGAPAPGAFIAMASPPPAGPKFAVRRRSSGMKGFAESRLPDAVDDQRAYSSPSPALSSLDRSMDKSVDLSAMAGGGGGDDDNDPTQVPIVKLVDAVLAEAVRSRASHVHFEPLNDRLQVRCRIDGQLVEQDRFPLRMARIVFRRLKQMAGINPAEERLPQEGSFDADAGFMRLRGKISFLPTADGKPSVVVHLGEVTGTAAALRAVLALQSAEGAFDWNPKAFAGDDLDRAFAACGYDADAVWKTVKGAMAAENIPPAGVADPDRVAHTAKAVLLFRVHYAPDRLLWRRAEQKALHYLQAATGRDPQGVADWLTRLEQLLPGARATPAPA